MLENSVFQIAGHEPFVSHSINWFFKQKQNKINKWIEATMYTGGFPGGASGKEPACQYRRHKRHGFDPWVRKMPWKTASKPTPVFLPGESHGQRSLEGYSPQGRKELDTTEVT